MDGHHVEGAARERAGLVEDDGVHVGEKLEVVGPLDEDAEARGAADAAEEAERHGDDEGARAAHHEEGEAAQDPVGPRAHADERGDHRERERRERYGRRVDAGEAGDEVLGAGLLLARVLHELEDAGHRGLAVGLARADAQDARHVDAAGYDLGARLHVARDGLAGEGGGVELGDAVCDHAVYRHALAGLDHDRLSHGNLGRVGLHEPAVLLDVGVLGGDVHHGCDRLAALAHGVALEELSHLIEKHDRGALRHMGLRLGEEDHRKGAEGRDRHEERLVEGVAATDVARRLEERLVAGDEVGDEEEREARVDVARRPEERGEKAALLEAERRGEEGQGDDDAVAPPLLLLVHSSSSANWGQSPFHIKPFCKLGTVPNLQG